MWTGAVGLKVRDMTSTSVTVTRRNIATRVSAHRDIPSGKL